MVQFWLTQINKEVKLADKMKPEPVTVIWPIPNETSLFEAIHQVQTIMKVQYPDNEVSLYSIFVGNPELGKLTFNDEGHLVYLTFNPHADTLKPGYMKITFLIKQKSTKPTT
ncbi:hypothetical protein A3K29_03465 [Candidatus Collierbacteria bacterium RIFOXYB2_FULL_46_14]|uniref:Uncharacterized protein n=2 Tax=Candidatus Collieribacteriota TaxID=1752725 RepID=A0A1F5FP06_9BACT|nr:MAG: hypothetical protein A3K29_03465 [Candidatus Collierbacteria bacterium RIFOXYB2_FULL_46_14]OGD76219.1 MAG: hypothetical protein A3K43_03465 [Candidatus Collierbacteria bacterium RIFOXYA2_FULL_46_20]OGD77555.1 MAG: hypothetical protein A3K39_03465 [Candidatus Collierbacteria bacterium RIFOXYC2_FULL_43_15]OGD80845.1 MAG: hypothetical protein A2320_03960 [Pseudomonadales bacterium GWC2_63_15]OGD81375.1 MAG: hypothetical protein A2572_01060 [Candidatus Collierbacteria bacterium RIFOXYD1_FUL